MHELPLLSILSIIKKWRKKTCYLNPNMNKVIKTLEIPFIFRRVSMIFWDVYRMCFTKKIIWICLRLLTHINFIQIFFFVYIIWQVEIITRFMWVWDDDLRNLCSRHAYCNNQYQCNDSMAAHKEGGRETSPPWWTYRSLISQVNSIESWEALVKK